MSDDTDESEHGPDGRFNDDRQSDGDRHTNEDRPEIRALDPTTVRRIAAGEVVERPASVVKELVENALDADASRVSIAVETGGADRVRIRDDGIGMTEAELRLAVQEHTTSKIRDIDDLDAGIDTLGFRGEALHTIGAVSRVTIRSKPRGETSAGTELRMEGGEVLAVEPVGCPEGTTIEVRDLFFNTPARRKFLKTTTTEFDHVNTVATQYALANPDVAISLEHDGREVFATEGRGSLESTVLSVYGREVAEAMGPVEYEVERAATEDNSGATDEGNSRAADGDERAPVTTISGLASHPETTRASRDYLSTFVNDRYVTTGVLREAVLDAYGDQLAPDRYPFAVLFVEIAPATVDVNVHPRKMEVRFDDEAGVKAAVRDAVRGGLLDSGLIRSSAPRGRSAPVETPVVPGSDEKHEDDRTEAVETGVDDGIEIDIDDAGTLGDETAAEASSAAESTEPPEPRESGESPSSTGTVASSTDERVESADDPATGTDASATEIGTSGAGTHASETGTSADRVASGRPFASPTTQRTLHGDEATVGGEYDRLPRLHVLGQLFDTYLVAETDDGLVLIDQHAADERINYERLRGTVSGETPTQALASPVRLELTAREAALFEEYRDALAQVGFYAGRTDERVVEVRSVPAIFGETLDPDLLRDVLTAFVSEEREGRTVDGVAEDLLADLACYPSITGNTSLREGSVADLLAALDDCENPYACPHGRPVIVEFDRDDIEDRFERDYPGHRGRRRE